MYILLVLLTDERDSVASDGHEVADDVHEDGEREQHRHSWEDGY